MQMRLNTRTCVLLLVFIVLGVYYPAIFSPVNSIDDPGMISYLLNTDNFTVKGLFFPGGSATYYRPLLAASFLFDKYVWGLDESFMHLDNIVFHLCNTLLVFAVARKAALLQGWRTTTLPFLIALFFAVHPINTEPVNWISGRTDLLAGFFLLLSVLLLFRPARVTWTAAAALSMLAACLVKETAIFFLPAALIFPFFLPSEGDRRPTLREVAGRNLTHFICFLTTGAGYFAFRTLAFDRGDSGVARVMTHVAGEQGLGIATVLWLVLKSAGFYLKKLFVPFPLNFGILHVSNYYLGLGLVAALLVVWQLKRKNLSAFFFLCAFSVGASALMIPLLRVTWTPLGERYMYIPSAFFLMGLGFAVVQRGLPSLYPRLMTVSVCALLVTAVWGTSQRTLLWQDNLALFRDTQRKSPNFAPAQNQVAEALFYKGEIKAADAIYKSFVPDNELINAEYGLKNKAFAYAMEGDFSTARTILKQGLEHPGKHEISMLKQLLELNKNELLQKKALPQARYADNVQALNRLYVLTGDPFYKYRLGTLNLGLGYRSKAQQAFQSAATKAPPDAYYRLSSQRLAVTLAASAGPKVSEGAAQP
jgi:protein O-mannosyl-transferase